MSEEDCGYRPPSWVRTGCKCSRCAAVRAKVQEKRREKRASDPEWRAKRNAADAARRRAKRANDPEWWAQRIAGWSTRLRERYANDPEYRAQRKASSAARHRAKYQALYDKVNAIQLTQEDVMDVIWESLK